MDMLGTVRPQTFRPHQTAPTETLSIKLTPVEEQCYTELVMIQANIRVKSLFSLAKISSVTTPSEQAINEEIEGFRKLIFEQVTQTPSATIESKINEIVEDFRCLLSNVPTKSVIANEKELEATLVEFRDCIARNSLALPFSGVSLTAKEMSDAQEIARNFFMAFYLMHVSKPVEIEQKIYDALQEYRQFFDAMPVQSTNNDISWAEKDIDNALRMIAVGNHDEAFELCLSVHKNAMEGNTTLTVAALNSVRDKLFEVALEFALAHNHELCRKLMVNLNQPTSTKQLGVLGRVYHQESYAFYSNVAHEAHFAAPEKIKRAFTEAVTKKSYLKTAPYFLGTLYKTGAYGFEKDDQKAQEYFDIAKSRGYKPLGSIVN